MYTRSCFLLSDELPTIVVTHHNTFVKAIRQSPDKNAAGSSVSFCAAKISVGGIFDYSTDATKARHITAAKSRINNFLMVFILLLRMDFVAVGIVIEDGNRAISIRGITDIGAVRTIYQVVEEVEIIPTVDICQHAVDIVIAYG